jgi:hypothetical protein
MAAVVAISPNTPVLATTAKVTGNAGASFDAAVGAAGPANALQVGVRATTANQTPSTDGKLVPPVADHAGRTVVTHVQVRELVGIQTTTISASTAETTIITAGGAGVFNDLCQLIITTTNSGAAATITIKDATAGTTRMVVDYPNQAAFPAPLIIPFSVPVPQAVSNANWTATVSANASSVKITAVFAKNT